MTDPARSATAVGFTCRVCGATVAVGEPTPWRCPASTPSDRHHALAIASAPGRLVPAVNDPNPFLAYGERLAWQRFARARGMSTDDCTALVRDLDAAVEAVAATGFRQTPLARAPGLSAALGLDVWIKDQTHDVAGSHKARHLFTILLQLCAAERLGLVPWGRTARPPLAIASCGNAALAAATLAAAVDWPIEVFVPAWASESVLRTLRALRARITTCARRPDDPAGDPCVLRCREAVEAGAVPFGVQGTDNALCLDGGRTLGWELADQAAAAGVVFDRVFVQVGGGALAACVGAALGDASPATHLHPVQAAGCAPLDRAWRLAGDDDLAGVAARWTELMWPWDDPRSAADGILDDETYDWLAVFDVLRRSGGRPVVAPEADVVAAHELVHTHTTVDASVTGAAGLAGVLALRDQLAPGARVAVLLTGITR